MNKILLRKIKKEFQDIQNDINSLRNWIRSGNVKQIYKKYLEIESSIIMDHGSLNVKIGWSKSTAPFVFPSIIGLRKQGHSYTAFQDEYIGLEAQENRGVMVLTYPVERGFVKNWDNLEVGKDFFDSVFLENLEIFFQEDQC